VRSQWVADFLGTRKDRVGVNNLYSEWFKVESGIPQLVTFWFRLLF